MRSQTQFLKYKVYVYCIKLLSGLDGRGMWLIIHLLNVSPHSVSGILRSGISLLVTQTACIWSRMQRNVEQMYSQPQTTAIKSGQQFYAKHLLFNNDQYSSIQYLKLLLFLPFTPCLGIIRYYCHFRIHRLLPLSFN